MTEATQVAATPGQGATQQLGTFDAAVEAELSSMGVDGDGEALQTDGEQGTDLQVYDDNGDLVAGDGQQQDGEQGGDGNAAPVLAGEYQAADGRTYKVPQELIDGNLRMQDYTRGTQALAQRWQQQDARDQQVAELYQGGQHLQAHRAALAQIDGAGMRVFDFLNKNPNLMQTDELRFSTLTGQLSMLQMERQRVLGAIQQAQDQYAAYEQQQTAQRVARVMPVFAQVGLGPAELKRVEAYFLAHGAPADAMAYLNGANAPWAIVIGEKARRFDEIQSKRTQATNKVNQAQRQNVLRPGSSSNAPRGTTIDKGRQRLNATGSVKDAVALELAIGEGRQRGPGRR